MPPHGNETCHKSCCMSLWSQFPPSLFTWDLELRLSGLCGRCVTCWASLQPTVWLHLNTHPHGLKIQEESQFPESLSVVYMTLNEIANISLPFFRAGLRRGFLPASSPLAHLCGIRKSPKETSSSQGNSGVRHLDQHTLFLLTTS